MAGKVAGGGARSGEVGVSGTGSSSPGSEGIGVMSGIGTGFS